MSGNVHPATGMIANISDLDAFVERQVLEVFDYKPLNEDVPEFREKVPTTENSCSENFRRMKINQISKLERNRDKNTATTGTEARASRPKEKNPIANDR